jgi:hypothetical protein
MLLKYLQIYNTEISQKDSIHNKITSIAIKISITLQTVIINASTESNLIPSFVCDRLSDLYLFNSISKIFLHPNLFHHFSLYIDLLVSEFSDQSPIYTSGLELNNKRERIPHVLLIKILKQINESLENHRSTILPKRPLSAIQSRMKSLNPCGVDTDALKMNNQKLIISFMENGIKPHLI